MIKRLTLGALGLLALGTTLLAQPVNSVPQVGVISAIQKQRTYSAASVGLVPASAATDIFCINGSTTAAVSVKEIIISGTAGTAITTPVLLNRHASLNTLGTAASGLALPVGVPNISTDSAATATLTAYTANPTINDAAPSLLAAPAVSFSQTTGTNSPFILNGGTLVDFFTKGYDIPKANPVVQQLCLNLNAVSISSGVLAISIQWTEN